ncbi:MAG TPA: hypothetical protein VFM18_00465 [Methanosarcina sp.]|nr:hypothetical protein [Methanosarcina sp.]
MSYCRFSSNNSMCDVYVYKDCYGGFTTHVAGNKFIIPPIPEPSISMIVVRGAEWDKKSRKLIYQRKRDEVIANITARLYGMLSLPHKWSMRIMPRKNIGLPHDGESFNDSTARECAERLIEFRNIGYNVPQYAIDALMEEVND